MANDRNIVPYQINRFIIKGEFLRRHQLLADSKKQDFQILSSPASIIHSGLWPLLSSP
jgi:hypothetical protein